MKDSRYSPAGAAAKKISIFFSSVYKLKEEAAVYFDGRFFLSNASILAMEDLPDIGGISHIVCEAAIDDNGMLRLVPCKQWIRRSIEGFPECSGESLYQEHQGFIKRLNAHLHFGFFTELWQEDAYALALLLLRLLHVGSIALARDIILQIERGYDQIYRDHMVPRSLIFAIKKGIILASNNRF